MTRERAHPREPRVDVSKAKLHQQGPAAAVRRVVPGPQADSRREGVLT